MNYIQAEYAFTNLSTDIKKTFVLGWAKITNVTRSLSRNYKGLFFFYSLSYNKQHISWKKRILKKRSIK